MAPSMKEGTKINLQVGCAQRRGRTLNEIEIAFQI